MTGRKIRCAIYTRKSTEEGLEQEFNSLDAQREACHAYIMSQVGEGWIALPGFYDDGGFSGGNIERPALQRLLGEIDQGRVDVVVVYKIDRLTRSLADFAKIVERLEKRKASFVSVTQSFNTTSSMGRLTLNVLLSFAQFEREVTAERIRDKFSASRKKGIFMGGNPPLGYDARDRKLVPNAAEAETVRLIFQCYLDLGSVALLRADLEAKRITTKSWISTRDKIMGGGRWYIGPLRYVLRNRVYIGEAVHKGTPYPGEHDAILSRDLFDAVQAKLDANQAAHRRKRTVGSQALLTGLIFDDKGNAMSPSKSRRPDGRSYVYYVSQARIQRRDPEALRPVPAAVIEAMLRDRVATILSVVKNAGRKGSIESTATLFESDLRESIRDIVQRIEISTDKVTVELNINASGDTEEAHAVRVKRLRLALPAGDTVDDRHNGVRIIIPFRLQPRGGLKRVEHFEPSGTASAKTRRDPFLIGALTQATTWRKSIEAGECTSLEKLAKDTGRDRKYVHQVLKLAFLAPDIQQRILTGQQPVSLSLAGLLGQNFPLLWSGQRALLHMTG
jgi:DNA invertase Pin-like site-specific DNA recombinase